MMEGVQIQNFSSGCHNNISSLCYTGGHSHDNFEHDHHNIVGKVGVILISIMICVGTVGNSVVILSVIKFSKLQKSYNYIIAALAVTDLIFNTIIMPFYADTFLWRRWRFSQWFCHFNTFLGTMVVMASALHIGCIALNRYVLIVMPHCYRYIARKQAIAFQIVFIWLLSFLTVLPGMLGWNAVVAYSDQIGRCNYLRSESKLSLYFIFGIGFLLPCVIMAFAYVQIYLAIHRSMRSMTHHDCAASHGAGQRSNRAYLSVPLIIVHSSMDPASVANGNNVCENDGCHGNKTDARDNSEVHHDKVDHSVAPGNNDNGQGKRHCLINETPNHHSPDTPSKCTDHLEMSDIVPTASKIQSTESSQSSPCHTAPANVCPIGCHGNLDTLSNQPSIRPHLDSTSERLHKRDVRTVHMILIVFLAFALTYLPFTVLNTVDQDGKFGREWYMLTSLAFWAGACVNPWIYGIMNKQFREAYTALLCKCRPGHWRRQQ